MYYQKKTKYGNKKCRCISNHQHDSRGEVSYCDRLRYEKLAGEIRDYQVQKKYPLFVEGMRLCNHIVDFLVTEKDGTVAVHEYKGFATRDWRLKMKLFKTCYPDIPYRVKGKMDI
jgi:hypothetical protein